MPEQRPDVSVYLIADNAAKALDFYVAGLGAEEVGRWVDPENGKLGHAEFRIGTQRLFIADGYKSMEALRVKGPGVLGGTSVNFWIEVADVEKAQECAVRAGAKLLVPVETMTVDEGRRCRIADPAGHVWTLAGS
jgi:PhnB protein